MNQSQTAWIKVWQSSECKGEYSFGSGREERALNKLSHFNKLNVKFSSNEKVLEAGCGDGAVIIKLIKQYGVSGYGADFATSAMSQAHELMRTENVKFKFHLADITHLPFEESYFDKVVCLGVIEHMDCPISPLKEICRVLKPGGVAIIMTPNKKSAGHWDRLIQQLFGIWNMGHQDEFTTVQLRDFVSSTTMTCEKTVAIQRAWLKNDSIYRKLAHLFDIVIGKIISDWGFYSYVVARKES